MKTKMSVLALAVAASLSLTAQAQQTGLSYQGANFSVRLYGLIDATIGTIDHETTTGGRTTGFDATPSSAPWFSGARWGITGKRDFADESISAIFKLENEYLIKDGSADDPNAAFGRDAWIGAQSDALGKLTFGRQNTLPRDFSQNYGDPYGSASTTLEEGGWTNSNNFKQMIYYAGSASGTRYNNGVVWKKKFEGGVVAGLGYQFGEIPGDFSRGHTVAGALAYNGGPFNVSGFVNQANVAGLTNKSYSVGGNFQATSLVRLNAGYFHYTAEQGAVGTRTDKAYTTSVKLTPGGKVDYELGYQMMKANNAAYNAGGNIINAFANPTGATATGTGNRGTEYGSVFYHLDQTTEVYLAADHLSLTNTYTQASTHGFKAQTEFGMGARLRF